MYSGAKDSKLVTTLARISDWISSSGTAALGCQDILIQSVIAFGLPSPGIAITRKLGHSRDQCP